MAPALRTTLCRTILPALSLAVVLGCGGGGDGGTGPGPQPVTVAGVTVTPLDKDLLVGETQQLTASARDANGGAIEGRAITWRSNSERVATVSSSGLVTATGEGSAIITAVIGGTPGSATVRGRYRFPNLTGTYQLSGTFDGIAGSGFVGTLTLTQPNRNSEALGGTVRLTSFLAAPSTSTYPLVLATIDADSVVSFGLGLGTPGATWSFAGVVGERGLGGVHILRDPSSRFEGIWLALR